MLQAFKSATRLAAMLLVIGVSSAFGALYTFDLTNPTRIATTTGGSFIISSNEDPLVQVELTALATSQNSPSIAVLTPLGAGVDDGQGGGNTGEDDIEGGARAETLVITPINLGGPFTAVVDSVTFTNTEATQGGDEAAIFLDQLSNTPDHIQDISAPGTFLWDPQANGDPDTFTSFIAFDNSDGNDDYRVSQIVLDITVGEIPEPSTWTLFGLGVAGLAYLRRRKKA